MKKAIQITIPEPCHENWKKMTPTQKGRHCTSCEKEVTDYTKMNDEQLVKKLTKQPEGCGRFNKSQLDREVKLERKSTQALAPYAASLLIPISLLGSLQNKANAQENKTEKTFNTIGVGRYRNPISKKVTTTGIITNVKGSPLEGVKISIVQNKEFVLTDAKGNFAITAQSKQTLQFQKEGVKTFYFTVTENSICTAIQLEEGKDAYEPIILGIIAPNIEVVEEHKTLEKITNTIKGIVTDSMALPLPGVNVIIKGTTNGTQTYFDGNYEIQVNTGDTIVFSYVGFDSIHKIITASSKNINLIMEEGVTGDIVLTAGGFYSTTLPRETKKQRETREQNTLKLQRIKKAKKKEKRLAKRSARKKMKNKNRK